MVKSRLKNLNTLQFGPFNIVYSMNQQTFSVKAKQQIFQVLQVVQYLLQLLDTSTKAGTDYTQVNGRDYIPMRLYLKSKQRAIFGTQPQFTNIEVMMPEGSAALKHNTLTDVSNYGLRLAREVLIRFSVLHLRSQGNL